MKIIVAVDECHGIGKNNSLPWHYPEDLAYFKEQTLNSTIVMGYNTWKSLPAPKLPNRYNIVLSTKSEILNGPDKTITTINDIPQDSWIIGGKMLYESVINLVDEIHITRIPGNYECDTILDFNLGDFILCDIKKLQTIEVHIYKRSNNAL